MYVNETLLKYMGAYNRKGGIYPLAFFVMLILSTYCDGSAVLVESNTTSSCNGSLGECLIDDDLEFLVNPYYESRKLASNNNDPLDRDHEFNPCGGPGEPYCINGCIKRDYYDRQCNT